MSAAVDALRTSPRRDWPTILELAGTIVRGYRDTGVTLRQLFYRLVAAQVLPNTRAAYSTLSSRTAEARRSGDFPTLIDRTRSIHRYRSFESPGSARKWLSDIYRRDRTEGQEHTVYLGVEKAGIIEQLQSWYGDLGVPVVALGGYGSQTYLDSIADDVVRQGRTAVLVYAGDFDPSGEDILRDFVERSGCFDHVHRIALNPEQVEEYELPEAMGKTTDSRAAGFVRKHGRLVQVELDALPPDVLRDLYQQAIDDYWDDDAYRKSLERENADRSTLNGGAS